MKLSVIVPVYNEEATVEVILKKLLKVKEVNEVILVDDGSTDKKPQILKKIKHRKLRKYRQSKNDKD